MYHVSNKQLNPNTQSRSGKARTAEAARLQQAPCCKGEIGDTIYTNDWSITSQTLLRLRLPPPKNCTHVRCHIGLGAALPRCAKHPSLRRFTRRRPCECGPRRCPRHRGPRASHSSTASRSCGDPWPGGGAGEGKDGSRRWRQRSTAVTRSVRLVSPAGMIHSLGHNTTQPHSSRDNQTIG